MTLNILEYDSAHQNKIIVKMDIYPECNVIFLAADFVFYS